MELESIDDEDYGVLTWDTKLSVWSGHATMEDGTPFDLWVRTPADDQPNSVLAINPDKSITEGSRTAFKNVRRGDVYVRAKVAEEMFELYCKWHGGEPISVEDFQGRLQLDSIEVVSDGTARVWYLDDDMFYGHSLFADLLADGSVSRVEMFG